MLISHEVPISLLEESSKFNDYDYCLLHLIYKHPEYRRYYVNSAESGRKVLLDNSVFELGEALTNDKLAQGVKDLHPAEYIVPDCLDNKDKTVEQFLSFKRDYPDLEGVCIGVVQGSSIEDMDECYKFMSKSADKIAIPFDSLAFSDYSNCANILERWCLGRQLYVQHLVDKGLWNNNKPHHLLGCSLAKEFTNKLYKQINIESCDTSNPIVAAIMGLAYDTMGLNEKPSIKLCDLITAGLTVDQRETLYHNVAVFRRLCND